MALLTATFVLQGPVFKSFSSAGELDALDTFFGDHSYVVNHALSDLDPALLDQKYSMVKIRDECFIPYGFHQAVPIS